ncbi:CHAT domain-containing protein [Spirosoma montaniterrae]|uniref:CHAT domain-containing protein n=1 Tax=Spirosoma montaniterrae TaxID=1178516 RepID=A0A1P9WTC3_9BACT|nr:CHAT domain-containing protein [Spirosoma montaniterrae]AQG78634.1 hypothetical protein AWR27_04355 [Spirosoma montaniterrae]
MRIYYWVLLLSLSLLGAVLYGQESDGDRLARACHQRASAYYNTPNPTDETDSLALLFYRRALKYSRLSPATAALVFDCHEKIGIYGQTFDNQQEALLNYRRAIAICRQYKLSDSLLFIPYLYTGSVHFYQQSYDSTTYYFEQAENLFQRYRRLPEAQRLFNSLGVLYHETGNYRQSINYFQKALQLMLAKPKTDSAALYSYKSNIATALRNLNQYDSAATIYKSLLPITQNRNKLYTNLGIVYLSKHQPAEALRYLLKVETDSTNAIIVRNALAETYLQQLRYTSAETSLNQSLQVVSRYGNQSKKNSHVGLTYKLLGDIARQQNQIWRALNYYQQSIIQLDLDFASTDVYRNPQNYAQGFSSYLLFESLVAKAECWRSLHRKRPNNQHRQAAISTYLSAFRLADYIEKSFDNEEARLFTVQKAYPVYKQVVAFLIQTYEETGDATYLNEAFCWSEKSKAAVLAIGLKENAAKSISGIPDSLLSRERNLHLSLSRLMMKVENAVDDAETETLTGQLRDTELELSRLTDKLHDYPAYYRLKFSFDSVNVAHLQRNVLGKQTALLSYFWADTTLFGFVLTAKQLRYFRVSQRSSLNQALGGLLTQLKTVSPGRAFGGHIYAESLYNKLVLPAEPYLTTVKSLIIIPHDELTLLPFETLHDHSRAYLLERFDVTYQYAASFLQSRLQSPPNLDQMLSVAPFDKPTNSGEFAPLTASRQEISSLGGEKLTSRFATKANFLRMAADYPVIHLATHAVADNVNPLRSFIAFYPTSYASNRLHAHEINYGTLPNTELVFLSACETASGKLVRGEGVMSLSRAFSLAGCPNLVTSLWKAEDNATAYISSRFYRHLRQGMPFSRALQAAKLDLLRDRQQVQFHSPQYWSHLIYIGTPARTSASWAVWLLLTLGGLGAGGWFWRYRRNKQKRLPAGNA